MIIVKHAQIDDTWTEYDSVRDAAELLWEDGFHDAIDLDLMRNCSDRLDDAILDMIRQSAENAAHERYESTYSV